MATILTNTPEHGKPTHGRSLPFLRCGVGSVFDWRSGRGRENSPSRPYESGMTVVDRPTISGQFLGRFHAHGLPNKLKMTVSTVASHEPSGVRRSARSEQRGIYFFAGVGRRRGPLTEQGRDLMLDVFRTPLVMKARRKPVHHSDRSIGRSQQQRSGVGSDQPGIECRFHTAAFHGSKIK
jgi:hypothetical protein